jgi:cell division protease FtsH
MSEEKSSPDKQEHNSRERIEKEEPVKKNMKPKPEPDKNRVLLFTIIIVSVLLLIQLFILPEMAYKRLGYSEFYSIVENNPQTGKIVECELVENQVRGKLDNGTYFQVNVPMGDLELIPLLRRNIPDFKVSPPQVFWRNIIYSVLPVLFLIAFFYFFLYRGAQQGGGRILSFGKSKARQTSGEKQRITFADVAGVDEAKEELQEIIEFLREPQKFQKLGGRIPKGVLLMGHPGTGKTLLAKAVAGEAGVPFFTISGSDFVEMFVGVGASRVRDLFEKAKKSAKTSGRGSIIFIDEIDAVGRQRFAGIGGGHDEREQTLNALLVEMDGFETQEGVILIGATNRPDVLDPALLRPGRFDRQIVVDRPDNKGREAIIKVHVRSVRLHADVDLKRLARQTTGFSGADLANLVNEGALLAARKNKEYVEQEDLESSIEKVMAGPERKSKVISRREKEIVAYHESGHALVALLLKTKDAVHKVSIIPRGHAALGYTLQLPLEDRYLISRKELLDKITILLAGRAAEETVFEEVTTGAHNDFEVATAYAQRMVCEFGMSEKLGNLTFGKRDKQVFLGRDLMSEKDYSEQTAVSIDTEIKKIIDSCKQKALSLLSENKDRLETLAKHLLEREVLDGEEVCELLGLSQEVLEEEEHAAEPLTEEEHKKIITDKEILEAQKDNAAGSTEADAAEESLADKA